MNYVNRSPQIAVYLQLKQLVQGLSNKKNIKIINQEVSNLINQIGVPAEQFFFICLLESFDVQKERSNTNPSQKQTFVTQFLQNAVTKSHFLDYFSQVLKNMNLKQVVETVCPQSQTLSEYLVDLFNCLKLPLNIHIIIYLSLTFSQNAKSQSEGVKLLRKKLHDYYVNSKPLIFPAYLVHPLIYQVRSFPELNDSENEIKFLLESLTGSCRLPDLKTGVMLDEANDKVLVRWQDTQLNDLLTLPKIGDCLKPVDLLKDIGPSCCSGSTNQLYAVLKDFIPLNEDDIFVCLLYMANHIQCLEDQQQRTVNELFYEAQKNQGWSNLQHTDKNEKKVQHTWNVDTFFQFCIEHQPNLKWQKVVEKLDRPNLELDEQKTWVNLMAFFGKIKKQQNFIFPMRIIFEKWQNRSSQVLFLSHMLRAGRPELVCWQELQTKRSIIMDFNPNYKQQLNPAGLQFWTNLDLIQLLVELSDSGFISEIRELFDIAIKLNADLIIIGLSQIQPSSGGSLIDELFTNLFPNYVTSHANSVQVLETLWKHNQYLVIAGISELYRKELGKKDNSCLNLSRVLDITQSVSQSSQQAQSLLAMAHSGDHNFSVPLGVLAGKREYLNFDRWVQERIKVGGIGFVNMLLAYIDENVLIAVREQQQKLGLPSGQLGQMNVGVLDGIMEKAQMKLEMLTIVFEQLLSQSEKLGQKIKQKTQNLYKELVQVFPQLSGPPNQKANQEVERLTDQWFTQYYNEQVTTDALLQLMHQWKNFGNLQEKELYACIVTNLFNEYQFHSKYPLKELQMTGTLFGGVIDRNLVEGKTLLIGLQIISVSLNNQSRYEFGVKALDMFKHRVWEWQWLAEKLLGDCDLLLEKNIDIVDDIRRGCEKQQIQLNVTQERLDYVRQKGVQKPIIVEQQPIPVVVTPQLLAPQPIHQRIIKHQQQPITQSITPPPTHTQIMVNQQTHTPQPVSKKQEIAGIGASLSFKEILNIEYELYDKEFNNEPFKNSINFMFNKLSPEYMDECAATLKQSLDSQEILEWFTKYIVYIRVPKTQQNSSTSQSHDYVLLFEKINKRILFKTVTKELCIALTILLETNKPTLNQEDRGALKQMGSLLGQLTLNRNKPVLTRYFNYRKLLSLNNQTITVICKICEWSKNSLIFKRQNVWMSNILSTLEMIQHRCPANTKYEIVLLFQSLSGDSAQNTSNDQIIPQMDTTQFKQPSNLNIQNLPSFVTVDEVQAAAVQNKVNLKELIAKAVDKAISEIIPPVITRSVTIALITTRELALKDFCLEPDEKKLLRGTHLIVQNLSGSLALVTCREPLKLSIQQNLKTLLQDVAIDPKLKEQIIQVASGDNLDLGCALIKKAVIEKALEDVNQDRHIMDELDKRKTQREKNIPYRDDQMFNSLQFLPEALQPKNGGLGEEEFRIYEEFGKKNQSFQPKQSDRKTQILGLLQKVFDGLSGPQSYFNYNFDKKDRDEILKCPELQDKQVSQEIAEKIIHFMLFLLNQEKLHQIVQVLEPLMNKIQLYTTFKWHDLIRQQAKLNVQQLENHPQWWQVVTYFLKHSIISLQEVEQLFKVLLEEPFIVYQNALIKILSQLQMHEGILTLNQCMTLISLLNTSQGQIKNPQFEKFVAEIKQVHQQLQNQNKQPLQPQVKQPLSVKSQVFTTFQKVDQEFYRQTQLLLVEWTGMTTNEQINKFIVLLQETIEDIQKFFVYATDICYQQATPYGERQLQNVESLDYSFIDQLSRLIMFFLRLITSLDKNQLMQYVLDAILIVLSKYHETTKPQFNQRPIQKLLINVLWEINRPTYEFSQLEKIGFLSRVVVFLQKCEPNVFPAFSYSWLELMSNRHLISTLLGEKSTSAVQQDYRQLIFKLLVFVREVVNEETLKQESVAVFYKGVIRVLLVIIQDFQNFSCQNAIIFADEIPFHLIQIRNIFLAAYPKNHNYPKPEEVSNIYSIEESKSMPEINHPCTENPQLQAKVQEEIMGCFILHSDEELRVRIHKLFDYEDSNQRIPFSISSFFILLPRMANQNNGDPIILVQRIIRLASVELRHIILNAIFNHIRYPNKMTLFYMNVIFSMFVESESQISEHIATILTQRISVERPQSWGLKYLYFELNSNQRYAKCQSQLIFMEGQQGTQGFQS